jgi:hypothetical protein
MLCWWFVANCRTGDAVLLRLAIAMLHPAEGMRKGSADDGTPPLWQAAVVLAVLLVYRQWAYGPLRLRSSYCFTCQLCAFLYG